MQYRPLGSSGIQASVVGYGAWAIGGWMWGGTDEAAAICSIHAALDAGITLIDTAPIYGFGVSEEIVGKAIAGRRDQVVLATKCGLVWEGDKGDHFFDSDDAHPTQGGEHKIYRYLGPESIRREVEVSLRRLQTDTIDLYQTHWQETTTAIEDTMAELLRLKDQGKIRAIGASNATPEQLAEYAAVGPLDADQELFSMLDRAKAAADLDYCAESQVAFLAYSPLAQGLLTGKIGPERTFEPGDQRNRSPRFHAENRQRVAGLLAEFAPVLEKHGVSLAQLAIAWTVAQRGCSHALVGARTPEQAIANAKGGTVVLDAEDLALMQRALAKHGPAIA
jgi:aryl-alcohol dehydrogenase-like predicted oxidoreductase